MLEVVSLSRFRLADFERLRVARCCVIGNSKFA